MKKLIKYFKLLVTIMVFTVMASGCGKNGGTESSNSDNTGNGSNETAGTETVSDLAYKKGLEMVGLMDEMIHSDKYVSIMSGGGEIAEKADEIAKGKYGSPSQVFCLSSFSKDTMISTIGGENAVKGFSDELMDYVNHRMIGGVISQINAQEGAMALATSSVSSISKAFVCNDIKDDCIYLYVYKNSYPVGVTFTVGENGAVNATGYYILNEEIKSADEKDVQQLIEDAFGMYGCNVEKIK